MLKCHLKILWMVVLGAIARTVLSSDFRSFNSLLFTHQSNISNDNLVDRRADVKPILHFDLNYDDRSFYGNNNYNNLNNVGEEKDEDGEDLNNMLSNQERTEEEAHTAEDGNDVRGDGILAYNAGHLIHKLLRNHQPLQPMLLESALSMDTTTIATGNDGLNAAQKMSTPSTPIADCTVDRLAIYKVVLHTYWTRELFPKHYPDWKPTAQWSKTLGTIKTNNLIPI